MLGYDSPQQETSPWHWTQSKQGYRRRKQCFRVNGPNLLYHLRCAWLHARDFSWIKPKRRILHPRLEGVSTGSLSQLCGPQGKPCYLLMCPVPKPKESRGRGGFLRRNRVFQQMDSPLAGDVVQLWDVRKMSGATEGMDGWINSNTHSRGFLRSGCEIILWGDVELYCPCSLCITASNSSCFFRHHHQGRKPASGFWVWNVGQGCMACVQQEMPGMLLAWLHAQCISQVWGGKSRSLKGRAAPAHILPQLSKITSFWPKGKTGSCRAGWDICIHQL